jgi:hypothetical protein
MMQFITEARTATVGVFQLMAFRKDWRKKFDTSPQGVVRSFAGIVLALPAFIFTVYAIGYFVADNPLTLGAESRLEPIEAAITWARYWVLFPVVAALTCLAAGLTQRYASWLVVQNWTVFVLVHLQALIFALYPAGIADAASLSQLTLMYIFVRMLAFWRVAGGTLGVPVALSAAMAGIPFIADWGLRAIT